MRRAHRLAMSGTILTLTLAACAATGASAPYGAPATKAASTPLGGVTIKGFAFSPATLTVVKGTAVTFTNADSATHTVTSGTSGSRDGKFDERLEGEGAATVTFDTPGTYPYFCSIHASMKGTIVVK